MTNKRVMGDKKGDMGDKKGDMGDKKGDIGRHGNNWRHLRRQKRRHWETHIRETIFEDMREKQS
jgi:hypothetical protein